MMDDQPAADTARQIDASPRPDDDAFIQGDVEYEDASGRADKQKDAADEISEARDRMRDAIGRFSWRDLAGRLWRKPLAHQS